MSFDLRQLRHALALVDHGSFARAAQVLKLSQPALSRSIQGLERQVGTRLFLRASDGVAPTDVGRLFVQRARDLVRMAGELDTELFSNRTLQSGRLIVGTGPFPADSIVATAAARFIDAYPNVAVQLDVRNWDDLLRALRAREVDLFVAELSTLRHEPDLEIEVFSELPLFFVARAGHPLVGRAHVTATDTFRFPFAAPSRIPPRLLEPMLEAQRAATDPVAVHRAFPSVTCNTVGTVKRIVEHSDTLSTLMLSTIADELDAGRLTLLGGEPWLFVQYGVVELKGRPASHAATKFRELLFAAERDVVHEERRLLARWRDRRTPPPPMPRPAKPRRRPRARRTS